MAGIKVPRYRIYKIGTRELKYANWNISFTDTKAFFSNKMIDLFEAGEFRLIAKILNQDISTIDFKKYILAVVIDEKAHFNRATSKKGIIVNGIKYRRFVGTTGGLKNNTILFVNDDVIDELNRRCDCDRDMFAKVVPAKFEAYKALTCSASQPIIDPHRILVVSDCLTRFKDTVIQIDNSDDTKDEPVVELKGNIDLENNTSDGFMLCTYEYMSKIAASLKLNYIPGGVCLRNAWLKGMLYPFPIIEFVEKYRDSNYIVTDIWGNEQDIRECDMIVTESSLKLWYAYKNIDDYMAAYKRNGYTFSVTKISPKVLDDIREVNYQYLQSYEFTDEDIKELCAPTIQFLKDSMCGDYESTIKFIGGDFAPSNENWQKALCTHEMMLDEPYIIDAVHRMIRRKIDNAKIGRLRVHGNYQIASGDPFALMQHICGLEVTGLLKAGEVYSSYWNKEDVSDLVIFRSPMTSHNNIRRCKAVNNDDVNYWYQYMYNIMIVNSWDTFCMAENGADFDSDLLFSTNNDVLLRRYRPLPAIMCLQQKAEKEIITEKAILKTNFNGLGNKVGTITNRVTSMMEVLSHFSPGTREYEELHKRILCGQQYQQDELDKLKGIIAKPMPNNWYYRKACEKDEFLESICCDKKPYFMTYVYDDYKKESNKIKSNANEKSMMLFAMPLSKLLQIPENERTEKQASFLYWIDRKEKFGFGPCAMNRICLYIESELDGYKVELKEKNPFNYEKLKVKRRCTEEHRMALLELEKKYENYIKKCKEQKKLDKLLVPNDMFQELPGRNLMIQEFKKMAEEICPNDNERLNIILDMTYKHKKNKLFCWDVVGDLIIKRLEELQNDNNK